MWLQLSVCYVFYGCGELSKAETETEHAPCDPQFVLCPLAKWFVPLVNFLFTVLLDYLQNFGILSDAKQMRLTKQIT